MQFAPPGPVTRILIAGLSFLIIGFYLDLLDEFFRFGENSWGNSLESIVTPIAVVLTFLGASHLYREQKVIGRVQEQREANFRDHREIHSVTNLYNASYFRNAVDNVIENKQSAFIWLIDMQDFDVINRTYGFEAGDKILHCVATTLVASVPKQSLVCHYAGDRFAVLLQEKETLPQLNTVLGELLTQATSLALYNSLGQQPRCRVRVVSTETQSGENARTALARIHQILIDMK